MKEMKKNNTLGYVIEADPSVTTSTSKWLNSIHVNTQENCPECAHAMEHPICYKSPPKLLIMEYPRQDIKTSHCLRIVDEDTSGKLQVLSDILSSLNHLIPFSVPLKL